MQFKERFEYIHEMYEGIRFKYYTIDEYVEDLMEYNEIEYICNNMTCKKQLLSGEFRSFPKAIAAFDITDACPANLQ